MTAAEARTDRAPWCSQHRRPRSECHPPWDRHVWTVRISDETVRRVEAKAKALRLDRNAGIEAAVEAWLETPQAGSAGPGVPSAGSEDSKPSAARTEPPAPVPAPRRGNGRGGSAEPPVVAADLDPDRDRLIAELRDRIEEMEAERRSPGTAVFMEPGSAPVVGYESPEVPPPGRKRGRAGKECPHRLAPGAWCKTCGQPK